MNKKIMLSVIASVFILSSSIVALANGVDSGLPWAQKADEQVEKMIKEKKEKNGEVTQLQIEVDGYDAYIKRATTPEQKNALLALQKDNSIGIGERTREALEIIGELPNGARRIKIEDAERIEKEFKDEGSKVNAFNDIAGAPDFEGGSGIHRTIYFMDAKNKEGIYIISNKIIHVIVDEKGKQISKPLNGENNLSEPRPMTTPNTN